jgi:hypothetical protein
MESQLSSHAGRPSPAWIISLAAQRQLNISWQLGVTIPPVDQERREKFCGTNIEAYRLYLNSIEQRP